MQDKEDKRKIGRETKEKKVKSNTETAPQIKRLMKEEQY